MGAPIIFKGANAQLLNSQNILKKDGNLYAGLIPEKRSGAFTAESGKHYLLDSSGGIFTITLPAGVAGMQMMFTDVATSWNGFNVTVDANAAETIDGDLTLVLDVDDTFAIITWDDVASEWKRTDPITAATVPLATATQVGVVTSYHTLIQSSVLTSAAATITLTTTDGYLCVLASHTANQTVNLPAAADNDGRVLKIKKTGIGGIVTIDANAAETIDGLATISLHKQHDSVEIACDGTNWVVVASSISPVFFRAQKNVGDAVVSWTDTTGSNQQRAFALVSEVDDTHAALAVAQAGVPGFGFTSAMFTVPTGLGGVYEFEISCQFDVTSIGAGGAKFVPKIGCSTAGNKELSYEVNCGSTTSDSFQSLSGKRRVALVSGETVVLYVGIERLGGSGTATARSQGGVTWTGQLVQPWK
jgi:hypothetical protein